MHLRRPKKRTVLLGTGILFVTCAIIAIYVVPKFNQPVEGSITAPAERSTAEQSSSSLTLTTPYFTTQYPARYGTPVKPASSASLDAELLTAHVQGGSGSTTRIALTVTDMPI